LTHLAAGELRYHTANGQEVSRPVEQIRYLQITGWDSFNTAEKLQRDGKTSAAVVAYERLLEDAAPGGGVDRTLLVQCRLVRLHEQLGRFDKAVAAYLAVIARMPECIETLRPTHIPRNDPTMLEKAAELVDAAIARWEPKDPVHISLSAWRATWPGMALNPGQPRPPTQEPALSIPLPTTRPAAARSAGLPPPAAGALRSLIEAGKHEEAIERIEFLLQTAGRAARGELYYWQARALAVRSMEQAGDESRTDQRRAGLAFMRVVILFPESPLAAECLYRAGELCAAMDQTGRAAGLWMELMTAHPSAGEWVQQARQALARIQTTSAPAR
jgi:tetratricopeptide (TPR) repeat protein